MSAQTTTQILDTSTSDNGTSFSSNKFLYDGSDHLAEPHVVVRARNTPDVIEMNVLGPGRSRLAEPSLSDNTTVAEPEVNSRKEWAAIAACSLCLFLVRILRRSSYGVSKLPYFMNINISRLDGTMEVSVLSYQRFRNTIILVSPPFRYCSFLDAWVLCWQVFSMVRKAHL
jgi:hypothetical protein